MKGLLFATLATGLMLSAPAAFAGDLNTGCEAPLNATGVSSAREGGRDFERFKGQVPPGLARKRAIENWQLRIENACPRYSAKWWRARAARIECEGASGREYCTATAQPARKLLSFLLSY
ncbi:MAG: hypothetical protein ABL907_03190 [Hyphomicrobium sp.]